MRFGLIPVLLGVGVAVPLSRLPSGLSWSVRAEDIFGPMEDLISLNMHLFQTRNDRTPVRVSAAAAGMSLRHEVQHVRLVMKVADIWQMYSDRVNKLRHRADSEIECLSELETRKYQIMQERTATLEYYVPRLTAAHGALEQGWQFTGGFLDPAFPGRTWTGHAFFNRAPLDLVNEALNMNISWNPVREDDPNKR